VLTKRLILLGVVPANNLTIPAGSEDEFRVGLAPIHGIDSLSVALVDDHHWPLLIT
jgi:hypothetical protein